MADVQLTDLVLLSSHFEMWPSGAAQTTPADTDDGRPYTYPQGDFLGLSASAVREDDEFVLYLRASMEDDALPFALRVMIGARFSVPDVTLEAERWEKTLVWLCYPYLRELVASITTRSPLPPYYLPALTKMPDPDAIEGAPNVSDSQTAA